MKSVRELAQELSQLINKCSEEEYGDLSKELSVISQSQMNKVKEIETLKKDRAQKRLEFLREKTSYVDPIYPSFDYDLDEMGDESEEGSCVFHNETEAKELIQALINQSYYYGHYFKWQGPGKYVIKPDWKYDCSGEIIYSAHYTREAL